ncbi:alanine racemase [Bdellovibrio sp. qaytius]|nr:alanine racemase [Bdellovibrio sp. qaytius]
MEMFRRTFAEINLDHLSHNFFEIKKLGGDNRFICPMVKANAYGHGDIVVAKHLDHLGASHLGVCLIEEGLMLRNEGLKSKILVFRGFDKQGAQKIFDAQMTPVVSTWDQITALESVADEPIKVHVKFNTGMNRLGFAPQEAEKLRTYFKTSKKLKLKAVLSHFYLGEDAVQTNGHSAAQAKLMTEIHSYFKDEDVWAHLLNSGGIASLAEPEVKNNPDHFLNKTNWGFRPGLMLYGYSPSETLKSMNLKPVMTFKSVVNNIRQMNVGETVSYGATWKADKASTIAVVPVGYADGVHRLLSNRGKFLFAGKEVPIVGRICMDFLMLDVTAVVQSSGLKKFTEEEVILFGYDQAGNFLSAEVTAKAAETITWEVLTAVGERVPRHYKGGQS